MAFSLDPTDFLAEAAEFQAPSRMGKISGGRNLYRKAGFEDFGASNLVAPISSLGSEEMSQSPIKETAREYKFAGDSLLALAQNEAEKRLLKGQKSAQDSQESGEKQGGFFSTAGKVVGAVAPFVIGALCDERVKHDVAPLQYSEVKDNLAQMAFTVQEIRGHS